VSPLQKSITNVIADALPIIIGIIIFILVCLYSFITIKILITSDERVESTNENEYELKKCGSTDIANIPDPKPQSD
jgi:preprotein translocase subunit SecY